MRQFALRNLSVAPVTTTEMPVGLFRCAALGFLALLVIALMISPIGASAQLAGTGTIQGTVTDSSGAVIPDATVAAQNLATNTMTVRTTTKDGYYTLSPLDAGNYTVTVSAQGFEKLLRQNVHVDGMQMLALDLTLQIGKANATVTVSTAPPALETEDAT